MRILTRFTGVRLLAVMLAVSLLAAMTPGMAAAQSGTNVIEITTAQQLFDIGRTPDEPLNGTYELMNNVDLSVYGQGYADFLQGYPGDTWTGWYPIGLGSNFTGKFYGNGHTISGLYIDDSNGNLPNAGLFGSIASGAVVDSVYLDNACVKSDGLGGYYGALVGYNSGSISNCYATGTVIGGFINGNADFNGGLVGYSDNTSSISDCYASVSVSGQIGPYNGGLVGENGGSISDCYATGGVSGNTYGSGAENGGLVGENGGSISNCYATGDVSSSGSGADNGGLVGYNGGSISTGCHATGSVSGNSGGAYGGLVGDNGGPITGCYYATGSVSSSGSGAYNGGLVGENDNGGSISGCYAPAGSVSGTGSGAYNGGLVGDNGGSISNSHATGSFSSASGSGAYNGGLVGYNGGSISNSYATGSFSFSGSGAYNGGLVGYNTTSGSISTGCYATGTFSDSGSGASNGGLVGGNGGSITNSYATDSVSGSCYDGGLVGGNGGSISNCYATGSVSGSGSGAYNGGLAGYNGILSEPMEGNAFISDCYATGSVSGNGDGARNGGLVGWNLSLGPQSYYDSAIETGSINNCYATGSVTGSGSGSYNGGLTGKINGSVSDCYATGSVTGSGSGSYNGGLDGALSQVDMNDPGGMASLILDCYATGSVSSVAGTFYGGLVGEQANISQTANSGITNSYCLAAAGQNVIGNISGVPVAGNQYEPNNSGSNGMTTAELQQESTFTNTSTNWGGYNVTGTGYASWDFTNTWGINEGYSYPYLLNVPPSPLPNVTAAASPSVGGTVNGESSYTGAYNVGDEVYLSATPSSGYIFDGWTGSSSAVTSTVYLTMPPSGMSLTADFTVPLQSVSVTGTPQVGDTLTANVSPSGATVDYQWLKSSSADGPYSDIAGATSGTYSPVTSDAGEYIEVEVTGTGGYSGTETSPTVGPVTAAYSSSGGSGGGSYIPAPVTSTTGSASVNPSAGGTVSLGSSASVAIPAGALQGNTNAMVSVQTSSSSPASPSGFMILGQVYQFTVNGQDHYTFNKPVTLTFTFDPSKVPAGQTPSVYYYDDTTDQWVDLGGTVSGNTITVTVNHFTQYAVMTKAQPVVTLTDITGSWAQADIEKLVSLGAISGYPGGTFRPNSDITRAEFVTVLVKALKLAPKAGPVFADMQGNWAQSYISTAAAYGIVSGYDATHFGPQNPITREQMAVMVVKAAKLAVATGELSFKDAASIDAWASQYVATAVKNGIISGYPDGTFRPLAYATRAEAVTVIAKLLN